MIMDQNTKDGMRKEIEKMRAALKGMRDHLLNVDLSDKARKYLMESDMLLLMSIDEIKKIGLKEEVTVTEIKEEVKNSVETKETEAKETVGNA